MADLGVSWEDATKVARAYYEGFEWSGCDGSRWERLPEEAQFIWVRMARHWLFAAAVLAEGEYK
ncbi:hypothetical protein SEA_LATRETIUM_79 [Mycobacterium phage Latretium]|nr:hypothetical protein SEA_LATRETIUM_79 [Mycobacterium phage Latretium]